MNVIGAIWAAFMIVLAVRTMCEAAERGTQAMFPIKPLIFALLTWPGFFLMTA